MVLKAKLRLPNLSHGDILKSSREAHTVWVKLNTDYIVYLLFGVKFDHETEGNNRKSDIQRKPLTCSSPTEITCD